ncbi:MAG: outer membrane lipoprotein carrier protein LolA [Pseudobdellovibrionaceae bacterium]
MTKTLFTILILLCASMPALAAGDDMSLKKLAIPVAPEIAQIESYFKTLGKAKARFVQTSADGRQARGTFYLSRPGKLRFEYDPPSTDFIVADGIFIYFYDGQVEQQTNAPIGQTLADFLLRKDLKLSGDLEVTRIMRSGGLLQISLVQTAEPDAGELTLGFQETPHLQLKKWRIQDQVGNITETELFNVDLAPKFASGTFAYHDPVRKSVNQ